MTQDCCFTEGKNWFRYRAAAIIVEGGCVLLVGNEKEDYLYSVGGGVHHGETAREAVLREVLEEQKGPYLVTARCIMACGYMDTLDAVRDEVYERLRQSGVLPERINATSAGLASVDGHYAYAPEHRKYGFTIFSETDEWWEEFKDYAYDGIEKAVEKKQPDHVADYIMALLNTWVNDRRLAEERRQVERDRQYNLFQQQENESRWREVMRTMMEKTPLTARDLCFESYDQETHVLLAQVASNEVYERLEGEYLAVWSESVYAAFGRSTKVNYRVP